ncbi:MAG: NAD(P)/FAD-dependent oxidoreductase [Phycisphaerales bacterium]
MSISLWQRREYALPTTADAIVVGAGITGISASLAFESRGLHPLLLDQRFPGWGATGRNAGYLMRGAADNYAAAVRELGREKARMLWRLTESNLNRLRSLGALELTHYRDYPSCLVAFETEEAEELASSCDLMREDGFTTHLIEPSSASDALWIHGRPLLGQVNPGDAVCDPVELLAWLRSKLAHQPVPETTVQRIQSTDSGVIVHTNRGQVHTDRLLVCTNAYTSPLLPDLGEHIKPNRGQMLALDATTLPQEERLQFAYYANHGSEYFRQIDETTVIVGGWRKHHADPEQTLDNNPSEPVQNGLEQFAERVLGRRLPVLHRWAGTMGFTPDELPLAGPIDRQAGRDYPIWICAGFTGHGMSLGHEVASRTAEAMLGADPLPDLFDPHRFPASPGY